jgi:hypothetical protein
MKLFKFLRYSVVSLLFFTIQTFYPMTQDGSNDNERPMGSVIVYQKWAEQLVELYNNGYEHIYTEILSNINQLKYEEQFAAFITILDYTREKNHEILTKKIYRVLHALFQSHFAQDEIKCAQLYSVQCALGEQFQHIVLQDESQRVEEEKESNIEVIQNKNNKKEIEENFYMTMRDLAISCNYDDELFQATMLSLLEEDAMGRECPSEKSMQQFDLGEYCFRRVCNEDVKLAEMFLNYLDKVLCENCFKGGQLENHYKTRTGVMHVILDCFQRQKTEAVLEDFVMIPSKKQNSKKEKPKKNIVHIGQSYWALECEAQGLTVIKNTLFVPTFKMISCIDLATKNTLQQYGSIYPFPVLITEGKVPFELPGIYKMTIKHPTDFSKRVSILWAQGRMPKKVLLHNGYFVRGYDDGMIEIDDSVQGSHFEFERHTKAITGLLAKGKCKFVASVGDNLELWNMKKKRFIKKYSFGDSIKDIAWHEGFLYSLIGGVVYRYPIDQKDQDPFPEFFAESSEEFTCLSQNENKNDLFVGLAEGKIKPLTNTGSFVFCTSRPVDEPVNAITIQEDKIIIQHPKQFVIL